jgi:hypothetical protein
MNNFVSNSHKPAEQLSLFYEKLNEI